MAALIIHSHPIIRLSLAIRHSLGRERLTTRAAPLGSVAQVRVR